MCKALKVVTQSEVPDLEGLTARMEGSVGQGKKLTSIPSCCVSGCKRSPSSVSLSSLYSKETVAQRECSRSFSWNSNPGLPHPKVFSFPFYQMASWQVRQTAGQVAEIQWGKFEGVPVRQQLT